MEKFEYQDNSDYGNNFRRWKELNDEEKRQFNEKPYPAWRASQVFSELYWRKSLAEICKNSNQKLEELRRKRREGEC